MSNITMSHLQDLEHICSNGFQGTHKTKKKSSYKQYRVYPFPSNAIAAHAVHANAMSLDGFD